MAIAGLGAASCTSQGSFELVLALPSDPALRPTGMTTVTVVITREGEQPIATTSVLEGNQFSTGDLQVANDVRIEVQLRDVSNRLVGVGEAAEPVDIIADENVVVEIPVRRPFVYASNGTSLFSFDPTLDSTDSKFQGQIMGVSVPKVVVSVGGDRLAIVSSTQLTVLSTDTNKLVGSPITIPGPANDAAAVPGTAKVAVAHAQGISIVDLDTGAVVNAAVGPVDRITVGPGSSGGLQAHGLIGRVEPPLLPLETCGGAPSSIVSIDVDAPNGETLPQTLAEPVSDLAAAPENVGLFAALPCSNRVVRVENGMFMPFAELDRASVVAVAGGRVYAAGTKPAVTVCRNGNSTVACSSASVTRCPVDPPTPSNEFDYVDEGAHLVVLSVPIAGGMPIRIDVPARRETIFDAADPAEQHAQVLSALGTVPRDLVALPGGQFVGLVATSNYYIFQLADGLGTVILPCLDATTADWILLDLASASVSQRVRTSCELTVGDADIFRSWACDEPPLGERSAFGPYVPQTVGALFGAR